MDSEGTAWAAGFFDGEGSINIVRQKRAHGETINHQLLVSVSQVDPRPLQYLQEHFGGSIYTRKFKKAEHKIANSWSIRTQQAEDFLRAIRPYVRVKGEQIDIALAFREIKANGGRYQGVDAQANDAREVMKSRLQDSR